MQGSTWHTSSYLLLQPYTTVYILWKLSLTMASSLVLIMIMPLSIKVHQCINLPYSKLTKVVGHYEASQVFSDIFTITSHVRCLAHELIGQETLLCHLADDTRTNSMAHLWLVILVQSVLGTSANVTTLPTFVSLKPTPFDLLRNCIYCRLSKAKRNSITGAVSRPMQLGADPNGSLQYTFFNQW